MDEMKITSKLMRHVAAKFISNMLKKKTECQVDISVNGIHVFVLDDKTHVHLDLDAEMNKEEFTKLLKRCGLY